MNNLILKEKIKIEDMIYKIRGVQVMLDSDLALLYQCSNGTKSINLAVKRHINRFPKRFMFQLNDTEMAELRFQFETTNRSINSMSRVLPYVFTEQGVAMLATVLKTKVAEQISIQIMDAFVIIKKYLSNSSYENRLSNIETKIINHDNKIEELFEKLETKIENTNLFFEGQIYDAYSLMLNIFNTSKESIIIIDNYIDRYLLDILSKTKKKVLIVTNKYNIKDIEKYENQYDNITLKIHDSFHDRFVIIDKAILYHCGASFNDLGKKCFALNKMEDKKYLKELLINLN